MDLDHWLRHARRQAGLLIVLALLSALFWSTARAAGTWSFGTSLLRPRAAHGAVALDGKIYVVGGSIGAPTYSNSAEVSNVAGSSWSSIANLPSARGEHGLAAFNGRIYAIGGWDGGVLSSVYAYNPTGNTWSIVAPLNVARRGVASAVSGGKVYAIGGMTAAGTPLTVVEVYDPQADTWSYTTPLHLARYAPAATTGTDGRIYVVGGQAADGTSLSTGEVYDPATTTWSPLVPNFYGRYGCAAVTGDDGKIYALGGVVGPANITNTVEAYNPTTGTWAFTAPLNSARSFLGAVVNNSTLYVLGGSNSSVAYLNTVERCPVNRAPQVPGDKTLTVVEDAPNTSLGISAPSDPDGDSLLITVTAIPAPEKGSVRLAGSSAAVSVGQVLPAAQLASLEFDPALNANGSAGRFRYTVSDGQGGTASQTITLLITPVNDAPVGVSDRYRVDEDGLLEVGAPGVLGNDTEIEGESLTAVQLTGPAHGALTLFGDGSFVYQPEPNYSGPDSFTYWAKDASDVLSDSTRVSITVTSRNDVPMTTSQTVDIAEDSAKLITLGAIDADGDPLIYQIVAVPEHGSLSGIGPQVTYTPAANYHGNDAFTFRVNDGSANSNTAMVSITVSSVNDAPVATGDTIALAENTSTPVTLSASDTDGDALTYTLIALPAHGTLSGTGANRIYTPAANYHGEDSILFRVNDGQTDSSTATVTLTVLPVEPPAAEDDQYLVTEDTPFSSAAPGVLENDSANEGGTLTAVKLANPTHGTVSLNADGSFTYTPEPNYYGPDSFTYRVREGQTYGNTATVTLNVRAVNDAPLAMDGTAFVAEDTSGEITLAATDVEGDALTYTVVEPPAHGTLSGSGATRTYTPAPNFHGTDHLTFRASDGAAVSNLAQVTLTVTSANDAPTADAGPDQILEATGATTLVSLDGTRSGDPDGQAITYTWSLGATQLGSGATLTTPLAVGQHTLTLKVTDPVGATSSDTVQISVRDTTAPTLVIPANMIVLQNTPTGAPVNFAIDGSDAVSGVTLSSSPASGSVFPLGDTTVTVTGTDAAGNQKTGSFVVSVVVPGSTPGKVKAKGAIHVAGKKAKFSLTGEQTAGRRFQGSLTFTDPVSRQTLKKTRITALLIDGTKARVFGEGVINRTPVRFIADVEDLGKTRGADRFRLELSDGRVFGVAAVLSGSVSITPAKSLP